MSSKKGMPSNFCRINARQKVAVVGHFPMLSKYSDICQLLSERGRNPATIRFGLRGSFAAAGHCFITGVTMTNKTLPRLLQLSKDAYVVMVGPSVPLAPFLLNTV